MSEGKGQLLYTLADDTCKSFKTCGKKGDQVTGTAKVNYDVYEMFSEMQQAIDDWECAKAQHDEAVISKKMFVPLIQATLRSAYDRSLMLQGQSTVEQASGATFAASILPHLYKCSRDDAKVLYEQMKTGSGQTSFSKVKGALERNYRCMQVTCKEIGGYYEKDRSRYHEEADPCKDESNALDGLEKGIPVALIGMIVIGLIIFYCMRRSYKKREQRLKQYDIDNELDDDDEDDDGRMVYS